VSKLHVALVTSVLVYFERCHMVCLKNHIKQKLGTIVLASSGNVAA
jgi:hypothetical protein